MPHRIGNHRALLIAALTGFIAHCGATAYAQAQPQTVSIFIVRHAETDGTQPTVPLSVAGRQRADLLAPTLNGVTFIYFFTTVYGIWFLNLDARHPLHS